MWTLPLALEVTRGLEHALARVGWHAGLAGGVLRAGKSNHDLDVIVFPHCRWKGSPRPNLGALHATLRALGWVQTHTRERMRAGWQIKGSRDTKWVEAWSVEGKRVDILVLS